MRFRIVVLLSVLLCHSLSQGAAIEERKSNMVVKILNEFLDGIITELTTKNINLSLNLNGLGRIENVTVKIPSITKWTDGVGSFGFKLNMNVSEVIATGYYDIEDLELPGLFPAFGKGNLAVNVKDVNLKLEIKATSNFQTNKFDFEIAVFDVQVASWKLNFDSSEGDPGVWNFISELIQNLIPNVAQALREPVLNILRPLLDFYGNGVIKCIKTELTQLEKCLKNLFETILHDIKQSA